MGPSSGRVPAASSPLNAYRQAAPHNVLANAAWHRQLENTRRRPSTSTRLQGTIVRTRLISHAVALLFSATAAAGQVPDTACTYRTCALRVEPRGLGTVVVRGAEGEVVARVGVWGTRPRLDSLLQRSDSALIYASQYHRMVPIGAAAALAGSLLFTAPAFTDQLGDGAVIGLSLGAAALSISGSVLMIRAQRALSRSVWWYNESLVP